MKKLLCLAMIFVMLASMMAPALATEGEGGETPEPEDVYCDVCGKEAHEGECICDTCGKALHEGECICDTCGKALHEGECCAVCKNLLAACTCEPADESCPVCGKEAHEGECCAVCKNLLAACTCEPADESCPVCGKALHEGQCCAVCKNLLAACTCEPADENCPVCGKAAHEGECICDTCGKAFHEGECTDSVIVFVCDGEVGCKADVHNEGCKSQICQCSANCLDGGQNETCAVCTASNENCKNAVCSKEDTCLALSGSHDVTCAKAVAAIGAKGYESLEDAIAAAASSDTVELLADAEFVGAFGGAALDLNGNTLVGNVFGTVSVNGGSWKAPAPGGGYYDILSPNSGAMYVSSDAVLTLGSDGSLTMHSGTVTLGASWRTDLGQTVSVGSAASFVIPEGMVFTVRGKVSVSGTVTVNGKVVLGDADSTASAISLTAAEGLNVESGMEGYVVVFDGASYSLVSASDVVATIGAVNYVSLEKAVAAAKSGDTITLLKDVAGEFTLGEGVSLDLNGKTLVGNAFGTVSVNGGSWKAPAPGGGYYDILSPDSGAMYVSSDAVLTLGSDGSLTMVSGTVTLGANWRTDLGQTVTIAEGAKFVIPEGMVFTVRGKAVVNGTVDVKGKVVLGDADSTASAISLTAAEGLNVESGMDGFELFFAEGVYILIDEDSEAVIGTTVYETLAAAVAAATAEDTIVLLNDVEYNNTLGNAKALDLNGKTLVGNAFGTVSVNGGSWKAPAPNGTDYYDILSPDSGAMYVSSDAVLTLGSDGSLTMVSGTVTLGANWRTDLGQSVTIAEDAKFVIPAGKEFTVRGKVSVSGTVTVNGKVILGDADSTAADISLTAPAGLNVESGMDNYFVSYEGGKYQLVPVSAAVASTGGVNYANLQAAIDAAGANGTVKLLADSTEAVTITEPLTIDPNGKKLSNLSLSNTSLTVGKNTVTMADGSVELDANGNITAKPAEGKAVGVNNGISILSGSAVKINKDGAVAVPANSKVDFYTIQTTVSVPNGGTVSAAGVLTQYPAEVSNYDYSRVVITETDSKGNTTNTAILVPVGASVVTQAKNGKLEVSTDAGDDIISDAKADGKDYLEFIKAGTYFYKGGSAKLSFVVNGFFEAFDSEESYIYDYATKTSVSLNHLANKGLVKLAPGSTKIELYNKYLKTLDYGKYCLAVAYDDGQVIYKDFTVGSTPATGDNSSIAIFGALAALSAMAMAAALVILKKKSRA